MEFLRQSRLVARNLAFELSRQSSDRDTKRLLVDKLASQGVNVILDVGANSGQYSANLRKAGFAGRIVSFEPLSQPFARLEKRASQDPLWDCHQYALGDDDGRITVNVAGNAGESSSVLPMLKRHQDAYPPANYVDTEEVPIRRLDSVVPEILRSDENLFLKIDVQGYERQVLAGSESTVRERCIGVQLELSFFPLYEGGMLIREALDLVESMGFTLIALLPCFMDPRNGQMLQADGIFLRQDTGLR